MAARIVVLLACVLMLGGCATTGELPSSLPVPPDVAIVPPAATVPPELAAFSGTWEGTWTSAYGSLPSRLIVERIETDSARVVYVWGDDPNGYFKGGWVRNRATVRPDGKLTWSGRGITFSFQMARDRLSLEGERDQGGQIATVTMKRVAQ